jgi:hypothetical protein
LSIIETTMPSPLAFVLRLSQPFPDGANPSTDSSQRRGNLRADR